MRTIFDFPAEIDCYTVFYNRFSSTIGTVRNPSMEVLEQFYLRCNEICKVKFNWNNLLRNVSEYRRFSLYKNNKSYLWDFVTNENSQIVAKLDPFDQYKIRITSDTCKVYDFKSKKYIGKFLIK